MRDNVLKLLGLMRRASALEIGADRAADATREGKTRLLLLSSDAGETNKRKAELALAGHSAQCVELPFTRAELSGALGVGDCTMAAVTDLGFARAFLKQLCETDGEQYAQALAHIEQKQEKIARRKVQKGKKWQSKSNGMRRTNI